MIANSQTHSQPQFVPFDPEGQLTIYVRNLPHWRQPGAAYFVTFRQDDSIPAAVLAEWLDNRNRWYRAHDIDPQWRQSNPERLDAAYAAIHKGVRRAFERQQAKMLHAELDTCHGSCVVKHETAQGIVADSLSFFHGQRLWMGDYVLMPNHVHAIVIPFDGWELEDLLGSIKKWTSRWIGQWLTDQPESLRPAGPFHAKPRFWQYESYDRIVRDAEELLTFRNYIAKNPQAAKLSADQYSYHAAAWLDKFAQRPVAPDVVVDRRMPMVRK